MFLLTSLQKLIAGLQQQMQMAFKDSLYRISRSTNAQMSGIDHDNADDSAPIDRVVADLMFKQIM
jgi:hypothetical protein